MKLVLLGIVFLGLAVKSRGFNPTYGRKIGAYAVKALSNPLEFWLLDLADRTHEDITKTALAQAAIAALKEKYKHDPSKYDGVTDLDEIVQLAYGSLAISEDFRRVVTAIQKANTNVDNKPLGLVSAAHFDAETIVEGNDLLLQRFKSATNCIYSGSYDKARESVGQLLHGLQDFYSHTNWIEMHNDEPNPRLATLKHAKLEPKDVASSCTPTCVDCKASRESFWDNPFTCKNNIDILNPDDRAFVPLTSGYYHSRLYGVQDPAKPGASLLHGDGADNRGKCSHGGWFDTSSSLQAKGGINKDSSAAALSPHHYLHEKAARVATMATIDFLEELREGVGVDNFLKFLGLYQSSSFTIVLDTTASMATEIQSILNDFSRIVRTDGIQEEYILVPFNGACAGPVYRSHSYSDYKKKFESISQSNLVVENGCVGGQARPSNTGPKEKAISGLILALQTSRLGSTVYVVTDSDAIDADSYPEASLLVERKRINVVFIRSQDNKPPGSKRRRRRDTAVDHENVYAKLAEESGGQVLIPDKDDDVGDLLYLTSSLSKASDSTLLIYEGKSPTGVGGRNLTLNVDDYVRSLTISLSGENPEILLYDPNGQVFALDPSSVAGTLTAIGKVAWPRSGAWTLNVKSTDEYDVLVKGMSYLDFQYTLVKPVETRHSGFFPVPEKPKIGSAVFIELTVTGLQDDFIVDEVQLLLTTDRQVKEQCPLVAVANETALFITETNITILEDPFQILLVGHHGAKMFTRVARTPIMPVAFGLTLEDGDLVMRQGETKTLEFLVERGNVGGESVADIAVQNDLGFAVKVRNSRFNIDPGESYRFFVNVMVPVCFPESATNTFTVTATLTIGNRQELVDSLLFDVLVDSEFVDRTAPVCFLNTVSTAGCLLFQCNTNWSATLSVVDTSSSIVIAEVTDVDISSPAYAATTISSPNLPFARNEFSLVNVTASCCAASVTLKFKDGLNSVECAVHKNDFPKSSCKKECLNGGRCNTKTQTCQCIGGYFGNQCEKAGCNALPAPANGYVIDSGVGSINKSVGIFCNKGYVHSGKTASTCCPFGWTDSSALCIADPDGTCIGRGHTASATVALIFALAATAFLSNMGGNLV